MEPTSLIDYLDSFKSEPDHGEGCVIAIMFKHEIYDNPGKLPSFFKSYKQFVERVLKIKYPEMVALTSSQHLGGFSVLADHDSSGKLTYHAITVGPKPVLRCFDDPQVYGLAMKTFSNFFGVSGRRLTDFLLGKNIN
jgi:hypothetical protein